MRYSLALEVPRADAVGGVLAALSDAGARDDGAALGDPESLRDAVRLAEIVGIAAVEWGCEDDRVRLDDLAALDVWVGEAAGERDDVDVIWLGLSEVVGLSETVDIVVGDGVYTVLGVRVTDNAALDVGELL